MTQSKHSKELILYSIHKMDDNTARIAKCLNQLSEEELWKRPNLASNSMGNLILHLCGNISQYIISSLGNKPDLRARDEEFSAIGGPNKMELLDKLKATIKKANDVIKKVTETEILRVRSVQGFQYSGIAIISHVVEHYSYHTGQFAFWTKLLRDVDLNFFDGVDLNIKNEA